MFLTTLYIHPHTSCVNDIAIWFYSIYSDVRRLYLLPHFRSLGTRRIRCVYLYDVWWMTKCVWTLLVRSVKDDVDQSELYNTCEMHIDFMCYRYCISVVITCLLWCYKYPFDPHPHSAHNSFSTDDATGFAELLIVIPPRKPNQNLSTLCVCLCMVSSLGVGRVASASA